MTRNKQTKPGTAKKYITERIRIEKIIPGGQALGTLENGKKIFLWDALPGELVLKTELTKERPSYAEGIAVEVEDGSPERSTPEDSCYLATSPWQILNYDYELAQKHEILREIFSQHKISLPAGVEIEPVQTDGKPYFYRNKMEYSLYFDKLDEKIHLAFHARGSHRKIVVDSSSIERAEIFGEARRIVDELNRGNREAREFQSLILRTNQDGIVSGGLFEKHRPHPKFSELHDQILGRTYAYSPNGFFQINLPVYEMALREIKHWIRSAGVLDLYAGVGTIGLSVANDRSLTLVECDKSAYYELENNCSGTNARPVLAKSEEALEYIAPNLDVILDPPRAGCRPELIDKLLEVCPQTVIYLSCNPATQARDVKMLEPKYNIVKVMPFNFFPRTPHLENLVILERKNALK